MRKSATTLESELTTGELQYLVGLLQGRQLTGPHLEIGTAAGGTLWRMMQSYTEASRPRFVVIDPMRYFPEQRELVEQNLVQHGIDPTAVEFREMGSSEALPRAVTANERYDLIFIDGNHKIRYVMDDLRWGELLNPGGLLLIHDYSPKYPGVFKSVNRFIGHNKHYRMLGCVETLMALSKEHEVSGEEVRRSDRTYAAVWSPILQLAPSIRKRLRKWKRRGR